MRHASFHSGIYATGWRIVKSMMLLSLLALATTGAICIMNYRQLRRYAVQGRTYWQLLCLYPFRAILLWAWVFWVAGSGRTGLRFTLPQWIACVLILLLSRQQKYLHDRLLGPCWTAPVN